MSTVRRIEQPAVLRNVQITLSPEEAQSLAYILGLTSCGIGPKELWKQLREAGFHYEFVDNPYKGEIYRK